MHKAVQVDSMYHYATGLSFVLLLSVWIQQALPLNVFVATPHDGLNTWNITARQYLNVSNFSLVMQPDCNLVAYDASTPFLAANLSVLIGKKTGAVGLVGAPNDRNCFTTLQPDGNLVVYQILNASYKFPLWSSETYAYGYKNSTYRYMILRRDGSVGVYEPDGTELSVAFPFIPVQASSAGPVSNLTYPFPPELEWRPKFPLDGCPYMPAEYFLSQGSYLLTMNGRFTLTLGHDCTLQSQEIWRQNNTVKAEIWDPKPRTVSGNCELRLQQDGRLEIRDNATDVVYWNNNVRTDDLVTWVLKLDAENGHVSVSDILNSSNVLWSSSGKESGNGRASTWPVAVGVLCGAFLMTVGAVGFWYYCIRPSSLLTPAEKAFKRRLMSIGGRSRSFSEATIKLATMNFGSRIGYGGFGDVFYGKLEDGQEIAAKVLSSCSHQSKEEFYNEIELLSLVHYKYLVTLIGYCFTPLHQILIYEFMSGGDLRHRLSPGKAGAESPLNWRQRMSITLQVAEGIEYLHDKCIPAIIHRDIKSNNILLTDMLVAKVADFGLSKLRRMDQENATHITTVVKGTPGYLDPEYHKTGLLTEKSDVYAFGIVMMEILTGQEQMSIAERVFEARRTRKLEALVDPHLEDNYDKEEFVDLVDLSLWCVRKKRGNRPLMSQVVQRFREIVVAPLESSTQPKVKESKDDHMHLTETEHSGDASNDTSVPFSGFSTGDIKYGT